MQRHTLANALRVLSADMVQQANSGHPGAPMGMADIAEVLWRSHLSHNPADPAWLNRDRFVLSNGHASALLYSLLHLSGYDLPLDELKRFRQLHSRTAGHPEHGITPGVETTTGPLGQGLANAVGFALSEQLLAAEFNRPAFPVVDHHTYAFVGDGCLMEGISHEACSLAGTLRLGKLIVFYDDNGISIDGHVDGWFSDDTPARFRAYGWQVLPRVDGHDPVAIDEAIRTAKANTTQPTLICCQTQIGKGSPNKAGSHDCHGAPLGVDELNAVRQVLNWPHAPFEIPFEVREAWDCRAKGLQRQQQWQQLWAGYARTWPDKASALQRRMGGGLPENWLGDSQDYVRHLQDNPKKVATRQASLNTLNAWAPRLPELLGGSADLAPSNLTRHQNATSVTPEKVAGNYLHYGVREFAMSAIMNGIALHGGYIPYGGTFLMFMEYARNAVRMAALMKQRVIFVYTHDSIGLGEDGPTHQPVEQLAALRATPGLDTWRPCDQVETAVAWQQAIVRSNGPSALIFSRQALPQHNRDDAQLAQVARGGYVLKGCEGTPELILIAAGSEVAIAMDAAGKLEALGVAVQVVSMPCTSRFEQQPAEYKARVLPPQVRARIAIEAGARDPWFRYTGLDGVVIGMDTFGESAPADQLYPHFGLTAERLVAEARRLLTLENVPETA